MKKVVILLSCFFLLGLIGVYGQTRTITGKVVSSDDNSPIPGVSVSVKGTTLGTVTNMDGNYTLSVPQTATALMFSFVGYRTVEAAIENRTSIDVILPVDVFAVDEVVVVGYGVQQKRDVTGAISTVKGDDIKLIPVQSFDQALQGKAAGVMITMPNGVLNNPPVIRVRGFNSITSSSYPLIVVDGVPVFTGNASSTNAAANPLADINPSDILSMDVLKDASATAIYGSRAANGVILITTKRGTTAKAKVNYDGYFGYTQPYRIFEMMNSAQYIEHKNRALSYIPTALPGPFTIPTGPDGKPIDTNWADYIYQTGFQHSHTFSVSGATAATSYYLSLGYNDQEGMIQKNTFSRQNARLNLEHKVNQYLKFGSNLTITNSLNAAPNTGSLVDQAFNTAGAGRLAFVLPPNLAPYNNDGSYNISGSAIGNMGQPVANYGYFNPVPSFDLNRFTAESDRIIGNFSATLEPLKGLSLKSIFGIDRLGVENKVYQTGLTGESYSTNGYAWNGYNRTNRWTWTNTVDYVTSIADKYNLGVLAGAEEQYTVGDYWWGGKQNVADPFFTTYQGSWVTAVMGGGSQYENYFVSYFGRLNFNYDKKYYLEASIRNDGFSGLAEGKKFGMFGGASAMWNISNESFVKDGALGELFSDMRLKASFGQVGNMSGIGSYASLFLYGSGVYGAAPTWTFNQAGNPDLQWETSDKFDVGLSFGMLKDRIQVDLNWFYNDVNDLILNVPQSPSKGIPGNTIPMNIGSMYNTGVEFSLTSYNFSGKDFSWTTNFNISTLKNEVTELAPGVTEIVGVTAGLETTSRTFVGHPVGNIFGIETRGVDPQTGRRIFVNAAGKEVLYQHEAAAASRWIYRDGSGNAPAIGLNQDGKILGSPIPTLYGGLDNTFTYKNFDFAVNFTYALGFEVYNGSKAGLRDQRWWNNTVEVYEKAWRNPGDITNIPKPIFNDNVSNGSSMVLSENVEKGDYVKVRNLSAGYTFNRIPGNLGVERVRLYAQVFNAFVFTSYTGSDPEVSTNANSNIAPGIDRNTVPQARTYAFGVNISF
ncbi:MAG: SusC/RagA family TonB-linked outer membrane protein [Bacteroidota bacterium]